MTNVFLLITSSYAPAQPHSISERPNVLIIECDQFRNDCLGINNNQVRTPNLDRLAANGMTFKNAFTPIPTCCPTRQTFLSGLWPEQHKGLWNYDITLPVATFESHTWTEDLRKSGYYLGYLGKWHVHPFKTPLDFGFNDYVPDLAYAQWRKAQQLPAVIPVKKDFLWMGGEDPAPLDKTHTHWLAQEAIAEMKKANGSGKPWHIRLDFVEPHLPCNPVKQFINLYNKDDMRSWPNFPDSFINK
ncbi:MAG: sulfatase-like hydrolase/transferase, partial [Chitinophagaceae bacterium]